MWTQTEEHLTVSNKLLVINYKIFDSLLPTNAFPHPLFEPIERIYIGKMVLVRMPTENIVFFSAKFHICNIKTYFLYLIFK